MGIIIDKISAAFDDNLETFSLLWLDASVDTHENRQAREELQKTISQLKVFDNADKCEHYIKNNLKDDRVVLIVSGQLGQGIVPKIESLDQVLSIYVYCYDQATHERWSSQWLKVRCVTKSLDDLIHAIQRDHEKRRYPALYEPLPISIFDSDIVHEKLTTDLCGHLVHSQLLIHCLLHMKPDENDKRNLIILSKNIYKKNRFELNNIDEFEKYYCPDSAIEWYTKDTFLSRLLNKALRTQNVDVLFLFHFFIVDIQNQLNLYRINLGTVAYHGQFMSQCELQALENSCNKFVSINSFLQATSNMNNAISHIQDFNKLEKVLFIIDANPEFNKGKPFANIRKFTGDNSFEILFMLGSIFKIVRVLHDNDGIHKIHLELCSDSRQQFQELSSSEQLFKFGHVLMTLGNLEEAQVFYERLQKFISPHDSNQVLCLEALANIADANSDYTKSLQLYQDALQIHNKNTDTSNLNGVSCLIKIGEIYRKQENYKQAIETFQQALAISRKDSSGKSRAQQATCLNNMGVVYQEQKNYNDALKYFREAFTIREDQVEGDEISLAMSYNNIGNVYYLTKNYDDAIKNYLEAMAIYKRCLPPQHPKFASTYNNMGAIFDDQGKYKEAIEYYKKAYQIFESIYPPNHPNLANVRENIRRVSSKL